jgi:hypothetical protein
MKFLNFLKKNILLLLIIISILLFSTSGLLGYKYYNIRKSYAESQDKIHSLETVFDSQKQKLNEQVKTNENLAAENNTQKKQLETNTTDLTNKDKSIADLTEEKKKLESEITALKVQAQAKLNAKAVTKNKITNTTTAKKPVNTNSGANYATQFSTSGETNLMGTSVEWEHIMGLEDGTKTAITNVIKEELNNRGSKKVLSESSIAEVKVVFGLRSANGKACGIADYYTQTFFIDIECYTNYPSENHFEFRKVLHHELYHLFDFVDTDYTYSSSKWNALNKDGYDGLNDGLHYTFEYIPGFVSNYAKSNEIEDRAETYSNYIMRDYSRPKAAFSKGDKVIEEKVKYILGRV